MSGKQFEEGPLSCSALLAAGEAVLSEHGVEESRLDAWYLFSEAFSMDRAAYFLHMQEPAPADKAEHFWNLIRRRGERIPLQQLLGVQEFMGLEFFVNESVLIPRQDTETLVEQAIGDIRAEEKKQLCILDLCTGSGCIGISLACLLDKKDAVSEVVLSDISPEALSVTEENIRRLGCRERCRAAESDLFSAFDGELFDIIVSNPPYIPSDVIEELAPEVRDHEPRLALDGEADGLSFYRRIGKEAPRCLLPGGSLYLEIGCGQGADVSRILKENGFEKIEVIKDLTGKDRVVKAVFPNRTR